MKPDETINITLQEIQEEILEEFDIDFSIEELFSIANSQFVGGAVAVNKRLSYFLPFIGTFVLKNKRFMIQSVVQTEKLKDIVSEDEYKAIILAKRIANKKTMHPSRLPLIKNLSALPRDIANSRSIASINLLYREIIEEHREDPDIEIDLSKQKPVLRKVQTEYISIVDEIKDELLNEQ